MPTLHRLTGLAAILIALAGLVAAPLPALAQPSGDTGCERLTFGDLVLGTRYNVGDSFVTEGVDVTVAPHAEDPGPCVAPFVSGFIDVVSDQGACGLGRELLFNNAVAEFDLGGPAREITIPYGEFGGTVTLSVNGDCVVAENMVDLDGASLGGVAVSVFGFGQPGQSCGVIRLGGVVTALGVGGQEFYIDGLSYCTDCAALRRSAFDDQTLGTIFQVGGSFVSGAATHTLIHFFPPGNACVNPDPDGEATIGSQQEACGNGLELRLNNINDLIDFGTPVDWLVLNYGEYGGNVNVGVNGDCRNVENLSDLNGQVVGGARYWAVDYGTPGQSCGALYVVGAIESFGIGGQEFSIDNIRVCPAAALGAPETPSAQAGPVTGRLQLAPARPNPARQAAILSFTLAEPAPVDLTVYTVSGQAVRTLVRGEKGAGLHQIAWDGRDDRGRRLAAGIYSLRAEAAGEVRTQSIVLLD